MTNRVNSVRVMLRFNLDDPRMARAREILEEGVRQERYRSKSHMIVDALLKTFDPESKASPPTMEAIRAALLDYYKKNNIPYDKSKFPEPHDEHDHEAEEEA